MAEHVDMRELMITHAPEIGAAIRDGRHGHLLRVARVARGWTQSEAAAHIGYSQATLSRIEQGQRPLTLDTLRHLADAYGIPPGMLGLASYTVLPSAPERLAEARRTHGGYTPGDTTRFIAARMTVAPGGVCDALQVPRDSTACRRDHLTYHGDQPVRLSATWIPAAIAGQAPALLAGEPGEVVSSVSGIIAEATGRLPTSGVDEPWPCAAWPEAARRLGRPEGSPMTLTRQTWRDQLGVLLHAETVTPHPQRYTYDLSPGG